MITKKKLEPHAYWCKRCDMTYDHVTPREGYVFEADVTLEDCIFKEGEEATLKGTHSWVCHDDDNAPCVLEEDDWFTVACYYYQCDTCGTAFSYDSEYCTAHSYSNEEEAKQCAINCCNAPAVPAEPGPPIIFTKDTSPVFFRENLPSDTTAVSVYTDVTDTECVLAVTDVGGWKINESERIIPKSLIGGRGWWVREEAVAKAVLALMPAVPAAAVLPKAEPDDDDLMSKMRKKDAPKKIVEL